MAIIQNTMQDDEDKKVNSLANPLAQPAPGQQPAPEQTAAPKPTSSAGGAIIGQGAAPAPKSRPMPSAGSKFVNIQNYMRGGQPGQRLAESLSGKVSGIQSQAGQTLQEAQRNFALQAGEGAKGISAVDPLKIQAGLASATTAMAPTDTLTAEQTSADELEALKAGLASKYAGPTELGGTELLSARADELAALGQGVGSEAGRFNLLRKMFGRPTYSAGQSRLDQALLQRSAGLKDLSNLARSGAAQFSGELGTAATGARAESMKQTQAAEAAREAAKTAATTGYGDIQKNLQAMMDKFNAEEAQRAALATAPVKGTGSAARIAKEQQKSLINSADYQNLVKAGFDPVTAMQYLKKGYEQQQATLGSIDPERAGILNALAGLGVGDLGEVALGEKAKSGEVRMDTRDINRLTEDWNKQMTELTAKARDLGHKAYGKGGDFTESNIRKNLEILRGAQSLKAANAQMGRTGKAAQKPIDDLLRSMGRPVSGDLNLEIKKLEQRLKQEYGG